MVFGLPHHSYKQFSLFRAFAEKKKYPPLILLNIFNRIKHRNTFTVCVCKLQIYKGSMTVYKAFQKGLQAFQYC